MIIDKNIYSSEETASDLAGKQRGVTQRQITSTALCSGSLAG